MALSRIFLWIPKWPSLRKLFWNSWYTHWCKKYGDQQGWEFMNYGYSPVDENEPTPELLPEDEHFRNWIQLYHQVAARIDLTGKDLVEVGSGRGGGCSYVHRYLKPASTMGIDLVNSCVEHCRQHHNISGLKFCQGDAGDLPLDDASVDVILNVESSHAYPSRERFFQEVGRVLRPGGYFLFTDLMEATEQVPVEEWLAGAGLVTRERVEIGADVLKALEENEAEKKQKFSEYVSPSMSGMFREFAGYEGSAVVNCLRSGYVVYYRYVLQKAE